MKGKKDRNPNRPKLDFYPRSKNNMIITNFSKNFNINQSNYNNIVSSLDLEAIPCPCCKHHHWNFHGSYCRSIRNGEDKKIISITRIKCMHCHSTHAILLKGMIPFSSLSYSEILSIIREHTSIFFSSSLFFWIRKKFMHQCSSSYPYICRLCSRNYPITFIPT